MARYDAFFPGRPPIDAYGNGGFRFADMSHRGSILILPSGVHGWPVSDFAELDAASFGAAMAEAGEIELLLIGTGSELRRLAPAGQAALREAGLRPEFMDTGAAARTYNVLLAEARQVAAALIAVP